MKTRILFGAIMIAVVAGVLWLDWRHEVASTATPPWESWMARLPIGLPVAIVLLAVSVPAVLEVRRLAAACGIRILRGTSLLGAAALVLLPIYWQSDAIAASAQGLLACMTLIVLLAFAEQMVFRGTKAALPTIAATLLTVLYLGVGGAMILDIRITHGAPTLLLFLAAVKFTDVGAYFTGSLIGRHKMVPKISPGKTWEGLVGGLILGAGAAVLVVWALNRHLPGEQMLRLTYGQAAVFGAMIGILGQFADLCESLLKRSAGVKDSGAAVPQFGGVLDIIDSPLLAAPVAWIILAMMTTT